jgi:hypothetical protein
MAKLTRHQFEQLTPEQQDELARGEALGVRLRQQILARAQRGMGVAEVLAQGIAGGLAMFCILFPRLTPIAIIGVIGLVVLHSRRLHRRQDALLELFKEDIQRILYGERRGSAASDKDQV